MKRRPRTLYTDSQKALMWDRWKKGESLQQIAQLFDRNHDRPATYWRRRVAYAHHSVADLPWR